MSLEELQAFLKELGEPAYRADQVFRWIYRGGTDFDAMTDLPLSLRQRLAGAARLGPMEVAERQADPEDGTVKLLLRLSDDQTVETVLLRQPYGVSVCVSTQAGCRMGCAFCASTVGGLARNLRPGEMAVQVLAALDALRESDGPEARVSHVVLMGIGEPLENYEAVLAFLHLLHDPKGLGISYRHITLSTSGLVPQIQRLAGEGLPITLAVSLHAPNDTLRTRLMPVNRRHPLAELLSACDRYAEATGRRITYEYALIDGVNDSPDLARELAGLLRGRLCHVNLIPLNPSGRGLAGSPHERVRAFQALLEEAGVRATVRKELGANIDAACGQLRRRQAAERQGSPRREGGEAGAVQRVQPQRAGTGAE